MAFSASIYKTDFETYTRAAPETENTHFLTAAAEMIGRIIDRDLDDSDVSGSSSVRLALFSTALYLKNSKDFQREQTRMAFEKSLIPLLGDLIALDRNIPEAD